MITSLVRIWR